MNELTPHNCSTFKQAQECGTDNEGYGKLIYQINPDVLMGNNLPPAKFCPWCGVSFDVEEEIERKPLEKVVENAFDPDAMRDHAETINALVDHVTAIEERIRGKG